MLGFTLHVHETLLALTLHVRAYFEDLSVVCIVEFTGHRDTTSSTGMGAGVNGNWEGNGNKSRLNMGLAMGMNHWKWEGQRYSRSSLVHGRPDDADCIATISGDG